MTRQSTRRRVLLPSASGESTAPPLAYPLDAGIFASAWSLRKLSATATAAIRVQRSSDNTQKDIGFIGRELDTLSLLTFCAGSTGTIATWYDQSGNGKHLVQATTAAQPIIVNAGQLVLFTGNKPGLSFDGARYLVCNSTSQNQPLTHFVAVIGTSANPNSPAGTIGGSSSTALPHSVSYSGTAQQYKFNAGNSITPINAQNNKPSIISATGDYHDGSLEVNPAFTRGLSNSNGIAGMEVGSCQGGLYKFYGTIAEYMLYGAISQNRKNKIARESAIYYGLSYSAPASPAYTAAYVFAGDSLTFGQNSSSTTNDWPDRFIAKLAIGTYFLMNTGFPGHTLNDMSVRANSESGLKNYFYPSVPTMLWVMGGTNDIIHDLVDAPTAYTRLKSYISGCIATGKFTTVGVCTIPPTGYNANAYASVVKAYNDLIRTGMQTGGDLLALGVTKLANLQLNSIFDDIPANVSTVTQNATYYNTATADRTHLTDAGYDAVATIAAAAVS